MPPANRHEPRRAKSSTSDYSVTEFLADFPNDAACLDYLWRTRHAPDGEHAHCPKCGEVKVFKRYATKQQRQPWTCTACGNHLHPTAGTIFHQSSTSLRLWFHAMYLMTSTRCGISAKQLERELGAHYKTAWRMFNRIRNELMTEGEPAPSLRGEIEGFFGNLKTGMRGTYKFISRKWLQSYLDEYAWRYNNRWNDQRSMFHALVREAAQQ